MHHKKEKFTHHYFPTSSKYCSFQKRSRTNRKIAFFDFEFSPVVVAHILIHCRRTKKKRRKQLFGAAKRIFECINCVKRLKWIDVACLHHDKNLFVVCWKKTFQKWLKTTKCTVLMRIHHRIRLKLCIITNEFQCLNKYSWIRCFRVFLSQTSFNIDSI